MMNTVEEVFVRKLLENDGAAASHLKHKTLYKKKKKHNYMSRFLLNICTTNFMTCLKKKKKKRLEAHIFTVRGHN